MEYPSVAEELMAQRDAIFFGEWVPHAPNASGQACLVLRHHRDVKETCLSAKATSLLAETYIRAFPDDVLPLTNEDVVWLGLWNDEQKDSGPVLDLLDAAIRLAKEGEL